MQWSQEVSHSLGNVVTVLTAEMTLKKGLGLKFIGIAGCPAIALLGGNGTGKLVGIWFDRLVPYPVEAPDLGGRACVEVDDDPADAPLVDAARGLYCVLGELLYGRSG